MQHSQVDTPTWKKELELLVEQDHMNKVWSVMLPNVQSYIDDYLEGVSHAFEKTTPTEAYAAFLAELIKKNDKTHDKYHDIFDLNVMDEEYSEDTDGFKNAVLKKDCDVIRHTLQSRSESLNEWKGKFYGAKSQQLYDTFYNMMCFASEYNDSMTEDVMTSIDEIDETGLAEMEEDECYKSGVLGYGIVSNILNHMYPRVFPGNYKAGVYSFHFLTGKEGARGIDMPSQTSEFCMVKDDFYSKTGVIETEHNYYFPYQTFGIYTLRIYRELEKKIKNRFNMEFPTDYRFLITNDFYDYVTSVHRADIATLAGNDDMLKFNTIW